MAAIYVRRGKRSWQITVHANGVRERRTIRGTEKDAKELVQYLNRQELAGINVVAALQASATAAPAASTQTWPTLRVAVPEFIRDMEARGEGQGSTPINYRRRPEGYVWQPLLRAAQLKYRKPHSMRHTFATWALEGNEEKGIKPAPILDVRDWMGHASVQETEGYLHRSKASHSKAVANLDAYVTA